MYTPLHITQWYYATYSCAIAIFEWGDLEHPVVRILHTQRGVPFNIRKVIGNVNSGLEEVDMEAFRDAENDFDTHHTIAFKSKYVGDFRTRTDYRHTFGAIIAFAPFSAIISGPSFVD